MLACISHTHLFGSSLIRVFICDQAQIHIHALCHVAPQEVSGRYQCACQPGFVGPHCEVQRNRCAGGPCRNGGRCHALPDGFMCQCPPGFTGPTCEVSIELWPGASCGRRFQPAPSPDEGAEQPVQPRPLPQQGPVPQPGGRLLLQLPRRLRGQNVFGAQGPLQDEPVSRYELLRPTAAPHA